MIVGGFLHVRFFSTRLGLEVELPDDRGAQWATVEINGWPDAGRFRFDMPEQGGDLVKLTTFAANAFTVGVTATQMRTQRYLGVSIVTDGSRHTNNGQCA